MADTSKPPPANLSGDDARKNIPQGAEGSSAGKAGPPASESGTPPLAPGEPKPELQPHQYRSDGTPSADPPIVDAKASEEKAKTERGTADIPAPVPDAQTPPGGLAGASRTPAAPDAPLLPPPPATPGGSGRGR